RSDAGLRARGRRVRHEAVRSLDARRDRAAPPRGRGIRDVIQARLVEVLREALRAAAPALGIDAAALPEPELYAPRAKGDGDYATNVALALSPRVKRPPRDVAQTIADAVPDAPFLRKVEVAGPGFINLFLTEEWLHEALRRLAEEGPRYGGQPATGTRMQV